MNEQTTTTTGVLDEFQTEMAACWRRLPNKGFFFALLAAWLALFQFLGNPILGYIHTPSLFSWLLDAYRNPRNDDGHGLFIPFLVLGLFWWKRRRLLSLPLQIWLPGFFIFLGALMLHVFGYLIQQPHVCIVALFAGIFGLMGLAWGREWLRESLFPFFLFVFSVPVSAYTQFITFPLQQLVSWLTERVAHLALGINVLRVGTQLYDPSGTYQYEVAAACSGIHSLIAIFLLATIYGFVVFKSGWQRAFLMSLALPLSVLGNLARMLLIVTAATLGGQSAGDYVHEGGPFGIISLLPYVPAFAGLLLAGWWLEKRNSKKSGEKSVSASATECEENLRA